MNQQLQAIAIQKESLELQKSEIQRALEELEKSGEEVYKAVGPILVRSTPEKLKNELTEKLDGINLRIKALQKQEERIKTSLSGLQTRLQKIMGGGE